MSLYNETQEYRAGWARRMCGGEFDHKECDDWKDGYFGADFSERTRMQSEPERNGAKIKSAALLNILSNETLGNE